MLQVHISQLSVRLLSSDISHTNIYPCSIKIQFVVFFQTLLFSYNQTSIYSFIHSYRYLSVPCEIRGCFKTGFEIDVYGSYHVHFFPACKHSHINISFTLHKGYYYSCFLSPWETEYKKVAVIYSRTWRVSSRICTISYSPGTSTLSHPNTRLTWT